jgi:serine/threonine-protein kinase HipA
LSDELRVLYRNQPAGWIARDAAGTIALHFDAAIVARFAGGPLLSVRLPVRAEPYRGEPVLAFLDGLLPEDTIRERLCRQFGIPTSDSFELLRRVGGDCAGALSFVDVEDADQPTPAGGVRWLDEDELYRVIDDLPLRPLGDDPERGIRISLAGAQNKLAVVVAPDGRIGLPTGSTPSTHILKPPSVARTGGGNPVFPDLVENELFCQRLARNAGFPAAAVAVQPVKGLRILLVARYDRVATDGGRHDRLHQEDVCQALGVVPARKYESDGGPSIRDVVRLLQRVSSVGADALAFIERAAFNALIGNNDFHGKNTSLLYDRDGIHLAPMYDALSTIVYERLERKLAMRISTQWQWDQLTTRHWVEQMDACGFSTAATLRQVATVVDRVVDALNRTVAETEDEGIAFPGLPVVRRAIDERSVALRDLPTFVRRGRRPRPLPP